MAGAKGCNDDCAAFIIYLVNVLLVIASLISLVFVIYVWVMQSSLVSGQDVEQAFTLYVPEFMLVLAILMLVLVVTLALIGIISTARGMQESKDKQDHADGKKTDVGKMIEAQTKGKKGKKYKKKGCCFNWCLGFYTFLCLLGFLLLFSLAIVAGVYSDKMTQFSSLDAVREQGDEWLDVLEDTVETQVLTLAETYPITWNQTQAVAGCCGWNVIEATTTTAAVSATTTTTGAAAPATTTTSAPLAGGRRALDDTDDTDDTLSAQTVSGWTDSMCCKNADVVNSVNLIGQVEFELDGCRTNDAGQVYTCEGVIATYIQSNLVKTAIFCVVLAILQLTLAVSSCVVNHPECFPCCNCKKKTPNKVNPDPSETPVEPVHNLQQKNHQWKYLRGVENNRKFNQNR